MESEPFHLQLVQNAKTTLLLILYSSIFKANKPTSYSLFSSRNTVHFLGKKQRDREEWPLLTVEID
jgi:hypothetical protein